MITPEYDYIIAGAGCAGLSLLVQMIRAGLPPARILLVDKASKTVNDRTWCFWEKDVGPFELVVCHSWPRLGFYGMDYAAIRVIEPYRYKMIRGIDFYRYCWKVIRQQESVTILTGEVQAMSSNKEETCIVVDGRKITANYIFNSIPDPQLIQQSRYHYLLQHFRGWVIETAKPCFDPGQATLMDFRVRKPEDGTAFAYTMPLSPTRALVEYTVFSKKVLPPSEYEEGLKEYIQQVIKAGMYTVVEKEEGIIPMTDHPFPSREHHIVHLGTAGGRTKPSTGYTFSFIQRQTRAIVQALSGGRAPFVPPPSGRRRFYDSVLLNVLATNKLDGEAVFTRLFRENSIPDIFPFLDDESTWSQDLAIIFSLPIGPFLRAGLEELL